MKVHLTFIGDIFCEHRRVLNHVSHVNSCKEIINKFKKILFMSEITKFVYKKLHFTAPRVVLMIVLYFIAD